MRHLRAAKPICQVYQLRSRPFIPSASGNMTDISTHLFIFNCATWSLSFRCFANSFSIFWSLIPCLVRPDLRDLHTSAARMPEGVTMIVCGAPRESAGVVLSAVHCCFRNSTSFSEVRGRLQLVLSRSVLATAVRYEMSCTRSTYQI